MAPTCRLGALRRAGSHPSSPECALMGEPSPREGNPMFLTSSNLAHYLIDRGHLSVSSAVDGDFRMVEVGRRNRNFKIYRDDSADLFVKQPSTINAPGSHTVAREAAFYRRVATDDRFRKLRSFMPELVSFDERRQAIVLTMDRSLEGLYGRQLRERRYPADKAMGLGRMLGTVHGIDVTPLASDELFIRDAPWLFGKQAISAIQSMGPIGEQCAAFVAASPGMADSLEQLANLWMPTSIVHGDPKFENWLIASDPDAADPAQLIDWELVDVGDPAWDVAMLFKEYLAAAGLLALEQGVVNEGAALTAGAISLLPLVQPSVRSFWTAYAQERNLAPSEAEHLLSRSIYFTSGRLILACVEYAGGQNAITPLGHYLLSLCQVALTNPSGFAATLMGE